MSSAYERAVELANEIDGAGPGMRMAAPLKRAEKIALAQVWANLAVAEALSPKASGALRDLFKET